MSELVREVVCDPPAPLPETARDRSPAPLIAPALPVAPVGDRVKRRVHRKMLQLSAIGWWIADCGIALTSVTLAFAATPVAGVEVPFVGNLILFGLLLGIVANISGLHNPILSRRLTELLIRTTVCVFASVVIFAIGLMLLRFELVGRYILVFTAMFCIFGMLFLRLFIWRLSDDFAQTICFLGDDKYRFQAANVLDDHPLPFRVKEFENESIDGLSDWAVKSDIDEIIYDAASNIAEEKELLLCLDQGVNVRSYPDFVEANYLKVPVDHLSAVWLFEARIELAHPYYRGIKRAMDVAVAIVGLIVTAPLVLISMALIKLESPGPVLYSQVRVGRFNRQFRIYKLRSMVLNAETNGAQWADKQDSRVLKIGRFLRLTRIDEFPQFWNILRGDMSLVGPRPERPEFVEMLGQKIPFYLQRHLVNPGLTGWAQINYGYGSSIDDSRNKLKYDLFYVKKTSIALDVQILLRTIGAVMRGSR